MKSHGLVLRLDAHPEPVARQRVPLLVDQRRLGRSCSVPFGQDAACRGAVVPGVPTDPLFAGGLTGMTIDGYFGGGGSAASARPTSCRSSSTRSQFEFLNTLSWLKGDHQFKFGVDVMAPMKNEYMDVPATRGDLRFRGTLHRQRGRRLPARLRLRRAALERSGWWTSGTGRRRSSSRTTGR